jgi:hypothetical protein
MAVFSWRVSILQRPHLGELQPKRSIVSDSQEWVDPAGLPPSGFERRGPKLVFAMRLVRKPWGRSPRQRRMQPVRPMLEMPCLQTKSFAASHPAT